MRRFFLSWRTLWITLAVLAAIGIVLFSLPTILYWKASFHAAPAQPAPFPVTVNPKEKTITEDPAVEAMFNTQDTALTAAVANAGDIFDWVASAIAASPWYEAIASPDVRFVVIDPGYRKEQVAQAFAKALAWKSADQKAFLAAPDSELALADGQFAPGTYITGLGATSAEARALVDDRFAEDVLSRYATSTAEVVPLEEGLTIASMIERETSDKDEMRLISGIIWNRLFNGMNLQIDATLQYAKASALPTTKNWWPALKSADKYIKSPYNTYQNNGLPPAPISNPSVAAVLAALNPKKTSCVFYFHDAHGGFHCSDTYAQHVALLKKYYGQGK